MRHMSILPLLLPFLLISACRITPEQEAAYRYEEREKERQALISYVKSNADLIHEVGKIKKVYPDLSRRKSQEILPWRYELVVKGDRTIRVAVDVSRAEESVKFSVACFVYPTEKSPDILEDMCMK